MSGTSSPNERLHFMDSARAAYMLLGIPFHVSLLFSSDVVWIYSPLDGSVAISAISDLIHAFRMHAFFLLAGFFAAMMLNRRSPNDWLSSRVIRLGLPFIASVLTIIPIQMLIIARVTTDSWQAAFDAAATLLSTSGVHWISHLWFLPTLIWCCVILAALWGRGLAGMLRTISAFMARTRWLPLVMVAAIALLCIAGKVLAGKLPFDPNILNGLIPLRKLSLFLPFFLLGAVLFQDRRLTDRFSQPSVMFTALGLLFILAYFSQGPTETRWDKISEIIIDAGLALTLTQITLSLFRKFLNFESKIISSFVGYSFSIYLVHHPLVLVVGAFLATVSAPALALFLLGSIAVLFGSLIFAVGISKSSVARLLFNGEVSPQPPRAPAESIRDR